MNPNQGHAHRERIERRDAGRAVLAYLAARHGRTSETDWRERIERGQVLLDGARAEAAQLLSAGQELVWERPPWVEPAVPLCAAVLYQDDALIAVAKPRGLPTVPGGGEFLEHTLLALVRRRAPGANPMHRLGRGTSGVVLFARTAAAGRAVQEAFRTRAVRKVYRALCSGSPALDAFAVDAAIGEVGHPLLGTVHAAAPDGRPSRSRVRVLARGEGAAIVEVEIETGRPHQIRIHLAHAGHPLCGDPLYGPGGVPISGTRALPGDLGYLLHAERLELLHPRTQERLSIECVPPPALRVQERLRTSAAITATNSAGSTGLGR
ncbi:MAG: pseudouridine synthase [Myxococcales bacterium]